MRRGFMAALLLLPVVEIAIAVGVAGLIGVGQTLLALVALSVIGVLILRSAGRRKLQVLRAAAADGIVPPADSGGPSAVAGVLLAVPGFLTALVGLVLMIPPVRRIAARRTRRWAESKGSWIVTDRFGRPAARPDVASGQSTSGAPAGPAARTVVQGEVVDEP
ncbi:FxsA family protein [Mumia qirimensis]|uniref:FxsA family protein n=1 Tax=Mumia qirimensis TaxID=3234852 RepID=UPI00351CD592